VDDKPFEARVVADLGLLQTAQSRIEDRLDRVLSACDRLLTLPQLAGGGAAPTVSHHLSSSSAIPSVQETMLIEAPPPTGAAFDRTPSMKRSVSPTQRVPATQRERTTMFLKDTSRVHPSTQVDLAVDWPASIKVRPEYSKKTALHHITRADGLTVFSVWNSADNVGSEKRITLVESGRHRCTKSLVIDPNSKQHMLYNAMSLIFLFYDLTVIPWALAWDIPITGWQMWLPTTFWTVDIFVNFCTGFYRADRLVMDLRTIAKFYLRSWFALDFSLVLIDHLSLFIDLNQSVKFFRFAKIGRVLRLVTMVRMLRVVRIVEAMAETHLSQGSRLMYTVSRYFLLILWFSHLLSCCWYGVGTYGMSDTGGSWFSSVSIRGDGRLVPYNETSMAYQYMTSLNWAVGQIALGPVDAIPQNVVERIFSVLATMIGFLFGSTLVSSLSAAMVDYQMSKKDKVTKMRSLRRFLLQHQVVPRLSTLVTRQAENRLALPEHLREADVPALALLSATLRAELQMEIVRPHMDSHPLFSLWLSVDEVAMRRLCFEAVHSKHLRSAEELFAAGVDATAAYFLIDGLIGYEHDPFSSQAPGMDIVEVHEGSWICEAALWTKWIHVGKAHAIVECDLLSISAKEFAQNTARSLALEQMAREYGRQYHKRVVNAQPPHAPYPTDLEVCYTDFHDIVVTMDREIQVFIGVHALANCKNGPRDNNKRMKLKDEITASKCLVIATSGMLLRVVSLVILNLRQANGNVLAQVGKLEGQTLQPDCELPGLKQGPNEVVSEALKRLLETKLSFIVNKVELECVASETTQKESKEFSIQTRYSRNICSAKLKDRMSADLPLPVCSKTEGTGEWDDRVPMSLRDRPVFVARGDGDGRGHLYAWLTNSEFSFLGSSDGEGVLSAWLQMLAIPRGPAPEERLGVRDFHEGSVFESYACGDESFALQMASDSDVYATASGRSI